MGLELKAGVLLEKTSQGTSQDGLVRSICDIVNSNDLDIFIGPEWLFLPKDRFYTKKEKDLIIEELIEGIDNPDALIIPGTIMWEDEQYFYNAAPAISGKRILMQQHKYYSGGSDGKAYFHNCSKLRFKREEIKTKKWSGLSFGIDICMDRGLLYHSLKNPGKNLLDLYFLVSCAAPPKWEPLPLKQGRYFLHAEGVDGSSNCEKADSKCLFGSIPVPGYRKNHGDKELNIYWLTLNS